MVDFFELEKRCKKLQQKKLIKQTIIFLFFIVVIAVISYFVINSSQPTTKSHHHIQKIDKTQHKPQKTQQKEKNISKPKPALVIEKPKPKQKLEQNLSKTITIKPIKTSKEKQVTEKNISKQTIIPQKTKIIKPIQKTTPKKEFNISTIPVLTLKIDFNNLSPTPKKVSKQKTIQNSTKKVYSSGLVSEELTFPKAMKLSKIYYTNGDYQNSLKWCKLAAQIDNNDEDLQNLFALNLVKLNKKNEAIKRIKNYLKNHNSIKLKYLLQRLEQ